MLKTATAVFLMNIRYVNQRLSMNKTFFRPLLFSFLFAYGFAAAELSEAPLLGSDIFAQAEWNKMSIGDVNADGIDSIIAERLSALADDAAAHYERYVLHYRLGEKTAAADALQQAAVKGNMRAQYELGMGYLRGENAVAQNEVQAIAWLKLAANAGLAEAQYNLGVLYEHGVVGLSDIGLAERYYLMAAEQNYTAAQYRLGMLYGKKGSIAYQAAKAQQWLSLAAAQGHEAAKKALADLQ